MNNADKRYALLQASATLAAASLTAKGAGYGADAAIGYAEDLLKEIEERYPDAVPIRATARDLCRFKAGDKVLAPGYPTSRIFRVQTVEHELSIQGYTVKLDNGSWWAEASLAPAPQETPDATLIAFDRAFYNERGYVEMPMSDSRKTSLRRALTAIGYVPPTPPKE